MNRNIIRGGFFFMAKKLLSFWLLLGLFISVVAISPIQVDAKGKKRSSASKRSVSKRKGSSVKRSSRGKKSGRGKIARSSRRGGKRYTRISGPASAMPPERVREIQDALKREGYYQSEPTGSYDKATVDAMSSYQKARNLRITGYPTAEALRDLGLTRVRRVTPASTSGNSVPVAPGQSKDGPQPPVIPQEPAAKEPGSSN
jgi:hypothetical protein